MLLCACGGQPTVVSPGLDQPGIPAAGGADSNWDNPLAGLPTLKSVTASLPRAMNHRNRLGAEYEPLLSSPVARFTVGEDYSLTLSVGAGQLTYATYAVGGLSGADAPEALTVVAEAGSAFWIAVSDYASDAWEWHRPAPVNGIQTIDLRNGLHYSQNGVLCYSLIAYNSAPGTVRECLLATSAEEGTVVPAAEYTTYGATYAELRVLTDGPAAGVSISAGGVLSDYELAENLSGAVVEYSIVLPDDGSLLQAQLAATPQGSPAMLLGVLAGDPLRVAVSQQSEDGSGSVYAEIDASGSYLLFWLDGHGASSSKGAASLAVLGDFDFARDSWPIDNSVDPPYRGYAVGHGGGMSLGASWFNAVGRSEPGLGSAGLYAHFAGDAAWAQGVAAHLQAQRSPSWLLYQDYNGLSGRGCIDKLNLARDIALAFGDGLPLYSFSGYPVSGDAGGAPVLAALAVGHCVLYVGEQYGLAYFYDPANGYNGTGNPYLQAVNSYQLASALFTAPFASLTGNWSIQGVHDSDNWIRDSFDPADKSKFTGYENPELLISKSGASPTNQIRLEAADELITIAAASDFWDSFPDYSTLSMQWLDSGGSTSFYTGEPRTGFNAASDFEMSFAGLLGVAQSGPAGIKSGTCVIPYYLKLATAPDGEGQRHYASGLAQPSGVSLYYAGPDWEVLLPPQGVIATADDTEHVAVSWSSPEQGPAPTGYNVYRTAGLAEPWTGPLNFPPTSLQYYYDNPPELGTEYWYAVSSYSDAEPEPLESAVSYADGGQQPPVGGPPVITGVSPRHGQPGALITFHATVTGSAPFTYAWDFGSGATPHTSSEESPTVTLGAAGVYEGMLTVSNDAKGMDMYGFYYESIPPVQDLVAIPPAMGYDVDFLRLCYQDPLVRRDDSLVIDPFEGVTPRDSTAFNDVLKTNGDEFPIASVDFEIYPVLVVIQGDDPAEIDGPDDGDAIDGIILAEARPGMLVADIAVLTTSGIDGELDYAFSVFSLTGVRLGAGTFMVNSGLPTVTTPPAGVAWGINVWDREAIDIGDQEYCDFTLDLDTLASATPDVLWLEFADGWLFDFLDAGPYSNTVLVIDNATYGTLQKDIRLLTRTVGGVEHYLGICGFTEDDVYDDGAPEEPGILKPGESYTLSLDDPGMPGIDYEYTVTLEVTSS